MVAGAAVGAAVVWVAVAAPLVAVPMAAAPAAAAGPEGAFRTLSHRCEEMQRGPTSLGLALFPLLHTRESCLEQGIHSRRAGGE
jgi:hypothetical protein